LDPGKFLIAPARSLESTALWLTRGDLALIREVLFFAEFGSVQLEKAARAACVPCLISILSLPS
jgi:hypothetical protein